MTDTDPGWVDRKLGDVLVVQHGFAFRGEHFTDSGAFIVVTPGNFYEAGGFKSKSGAEKYYSAVPPDAFVLEEGDLVIAMTEQSMGLLGSSGLIPKGGPYLHNQRIGRVVITAPDLADQSFLYYLFNTAHVRYQIQATATGSKVRHTAPTRIEAVMARFPPREVQRKVGRMLLDYDELIANNARRIQVLEEMARMIFREWFVEFRYPGHEAHSHESSLPPGWHIETLAAVADVNARNLRTSDAVGKIRYLDISAVSTGHVGDASEMDYSDAPGRARRLVRHGDVIWSTVRPNRRSYGLLLNPSSDLVVSTGFAVLTAKSIAPSLFYRLVTTDEFVSYLVGRATGAAYPAVTGRVFESAPVLRPAADLVERFDSIVGPMDQLSERLRRANESLREARDLLLPRLISGEVDVSELDIEGVPAA